MKYFTVLTNTGAAKIAAATANNTTINLTHIAVGDANGTEVAPTISQTTLVHEVYRTALSEKKVDENNSNHIIASSVIPADQGNFWIREVGVFDADGDLIAVGNYPETYKSILTQGAAKEVILRVVFEVANTDAVNLVIDPSIVMASQEFVNEKLKEKAPKDHAHDDKADISYVDAKPTGFKNLLINGDFRIWQRGTSFNTNYTYSADRWVLNTAMSVTKQQNTDNTLPFKNYARIVSSGNGSQFQQRLEIDNLKPNTTYTLSAYLRGDVAQNIKINNYFYYNNKASFIKINEVDQSLNIETMWKRYSITFTTGKNVFDKTFTNSDFWLIAFAVENGKTLDIAQVQLELRDKATEFEYRPYPLELMMCQRYYEEVYSGMDAYGGTGGWVLNYSKFVPKRVVPSIVINILTRSEKFSTTTYIDYISKNGCRVGLNQSLSGNGNYVLQLNVDAEIY